MANEIWRTIPGFKGRYEVSSLGNIRNIRKAALKPRMPTLNKHGYLRLNLTTNSKVTRNIEVHTLVALTFIRKRKKGEMINHKNYIKTDNRASNLEYVTHRENITHRCIRSNKYTGAIFVRKTGKWSGVVQHKGVIKYLGTFNNPLSAHQAYKNYLKENKLENKYAGVLHDQR